jgi:hypothetical protein
MSWFFDGFMEAERRKKAGLVRIEVWVPADKADEVRKAIDWVLTPPEK